VGDILLIGYRLNWLSAGDAEALAAGVFHGDGDGVQAAVIHLNCAAGGRGGVARVFALRRSAKERALHAGVVHPGRYDFAAMFFHLRHLVICMTMVTRCGGGGLLNMGQSAGASACPGG